MTRKATIPLYDGDDFEKMAELRRKVDIAERKARAEAAAPKRLGDDEDADAAVQAARAALSAFIDEAAERAEMWELHSIGHEDFRNLLRDNPPRKVKKTDDEGKEHEVTHDDDEMFDVNTESFPKALLEFVDEDDNEIRTVHAPFESLTALKKRLKRLSVGEFDTFWVTAFQLNNGGVADPKATPYYDGAR